MRNARLGHANLLAQGLWVPWRWNSLLNALRLWPLWWDQLISLTRIWFYTLTLLCYFRYRNSDFSDLQVWPSCMFFHFYFILNFCFSILKFSFVSFISSAPRSSAHQSSPFRTWFGLESISIFSRGPKFISKSLILDLT